jgi:ketosteroid isomerase-like protein/mannose-6-phosphate isomerase-like protein (cupin superfamily)
MRWYTWIVLAAASLAAACAPSVNVEQERAALLAADRAWSESIKDADKFMSYFAPDGSLYPPGMPVATGTEAIRKMFDEMTAAPGFSLAWRATRAEVGAGGDVGYTVGTYEMSMGGPTENGKYVTIWRKQADGQWKVVEDIANADAPPAAPSTPHTMVAASAVKWGDAPANLPRGARMAVLAGDPSQAQPFVARFQFPAGYRIAAHWHPADEHVTVLSGTMGVGMGDRFDEKALQDLGAGGYVAIPAEMRHYALARTAVTMQLQGIGPFATNYVNPADDPSKQK